MGRKKTNLIYTYFDYNENNKTSKCLIENCEQVLRGNHGANLLRHFYTQHRQLHDKILHENKKNKENVPPKKDDNHMKLEEEMQENTTEEHDFVEGEDSEHENGYEVWFAEAGNLNLNIDNQGQNKLTTVRCAAHTLQLAIRDACSELRDLLEQCRQIARVLRSPNNALQLRVQGLPQAIIDCPTRWDSTADMVERILLFKDFLSGRTEPVFQTFAVEDTWQKLNETLDALKPCRILSKTIQHEQLTFGDFYLAWLKCILEIENINTVFAIFLVICMREREKTLLENECFLGAIYLDPRVNSMLSNQQLELARAHLVQTYQRYLRLNSTVSVRETENETPDDPIPSTSSSILDIFLQTQFRQRYQDLPHLNHNDNLQISLLAFLNEPLLPSNTNILNYWESKKITDPQLYLISKIALATPATQVSVERLFSSLKFIMNNLRISLKDTTIDDILIVRNNHLYHLCQ
ncbi:zinc finger BED domain-containing protein 4-like isoform X2 [Helicoverpa zea]|uniref:zinc finger BED domain-containing protein 4-like isoform X2 n=1 Tax=Helicoverpa zea TaxID=7113 RepID=UPI001F599A3E|nr:zinc finger BED domain-containing protein 4-like isoform X2 [Helicoverpa zea]XP_047022776.1 zinc finger BED domain-containing protein 4-like isoform X2 [Helicoverpa zea]XP_047036936.1 zinc finger BED domain-containing protein 4-like isoform X2 [Helicoverpa zea]XP_047041784.1 zinc finger BED domain-containing protein 4-like isoform X2 [Helicoverpa zea]